MAVEPEKLVWSPRIILYREYAFPIRAGNWRALLYRKEDVEQWIAPLLVLTMLVILAEVFL